MSGPGPLQRRSLLALLVALSGGAAGCEAVDELLGRSGGNDVDTLRLEAIALTSDHPQVPGNPGGPAVLTSAGVVRFTATGTFVNLDANNEESFREITGAVIFQSTNPLLHPGADGRIVVTGTGAGTAVIKATSPAVGDIPAYESNSITLTAP